jgi:hypothetical protein
MWWEAIKLISVACGGIIIGMSIGYVCGHNEGYRQSNEWHERAVMIKIDQANKS